MHILSILAVASASVALSSVAIAEDALHCGVLSDEPHVRVVASDAKSGKWVASVEYRRFGVSHALTTSPAGDKDRLARHCTAWIDRHLDKRDARRLHDQLK